MANIEQRDVTRVCQRSSTSNILKASSLFDYIDENGCVPLVLVPNKRHIPVRFTIPANVVCVVQKDGAHYGVLENGRYTAGYRYRVAYIVNHQSISYNFNVMDCPTRDNVMVSVEITLVFNIVKADDFCYKLGAMHFDDLLHSVAEEAIRTLVRSIDHTTVYELRSSCSETLLKILNHTFQQFGVNFSSTTVKNVALPLLISQSLENASKFESLIAKHVKEQEYAIKKINDSADLDKKNFFVKQENKLTNLRSKKERITIENQKKIEEQKRLNEREIIKAEQIAESNKTSALASYRDSQTTAKTNADKMIQNATAKLKNSSREIDQWQKEELMRSEKELLFAKNEYDIIKMKVEARENENMKGEREQEIRMRRTDALNNLAKNGQLIISGKSGKSLLEQFTF